MNSLASQIIADIIVREMSLPNDNVWIDELGYNIPTSEDLMVAVGMSSSIPMSSQSFIEDRDTPPDSVFEVQRVQLRENIDINIFARNSDALTRRWEVIAALGSIYSQQQQETNAFKIFKLPNTFLNTSAAEGGSQLARYTLSFACFVWYSKEKQLTVDGGDYYEEFSTRVDDENTIGTPTGVIEFTIDEDTEL